MKLFINFDNLTPFLVDRGLASLDVGNGISHRNLPGLNLVHVQGPVQVFLL
jgi:hypothetical protein